MADKMQATGQTLKVRVRSISFEAEAINSYELVSADGSLLPPFRAGAHIDVHLGDGLRESFVRQYSLCNDPSERHRYVIAVLRDPNGLGGSRALHEKVHPGDTLTISEPRNYFPLAEGADRHLLVAGGIGVTPMMAMIAELRAQGADYLLHYCTRSPEVTAFRNRLAGLAEEGRVTFHHDGGDPKKGLSLPETLKSHTPGTHLYYCGPPGFMAAAKSACAHWPRECVHFEYFSAPEEAKEAERLDRPFQIKIASTGELLDVPEGESIVDTLRAHGVYVETSCEDGYCGTCLTRYLDGEPEHRDVVLDEEDQAEYVLICCSRSKSPLLVLDL